MDTAALKKLGKIAFYFIIILINLSLLFFIARAFLDFQQLHNNFRFIILLKRINHFFVSDLNGDMKDDIISITFYEPYPRQNQVKCFAPFLSSGQLKFDYFFEKLFSSGAFFCQPQDINGDGMIDIPVIEIKRNVGITLTLLDMSGNPSKVINIPEPINEENYLADVFFEDIDGNQRKEMILVLNTTYKLNPRRINVYDIKNQHKLWEYLLGCTPWMTKIVDVNKDGKKEIILSGWSPHNGISANGTDDDHSYIILLNYEGKKLWQREMGGYFTQIFLDVGDIDQDGEIEIITCKECHRQPDPERGEIRILDAITGKPEKESLIDDVSFYDIKIAHLDGINPSLVVGNSRGNVIILNRYLKPLRQLNLELHESVRILGIAKLGINPKDSFILVQSGAGGENFYILSHDLDKLNKTSFKFYQGLEIDLRLLSIMNQNEFDIVLNADNLYLIRKETTSLLSIIDSFIKSRLPVYLIILLSFDTLLLFFIKKQKADYYDIQSSKENWTEAVQEIAHKMKSPLFTIQLEAERLISALDKEENLSDFEELKSSQQSILDDIKKLKSMNRTLMKILEIRPLKLNTVDLNIILKDIVQRFSPLLRNITFELNLDEESTLALLDKEQVEEALSNIIENSIDALPQGGDIKITTTVIYVLRHKHPKEIEIEIEDNGKGIAQNEFQEIFKPYFTTKENGIGIGLTITKRIVESHGGRIEVQSKQGIGTRFAIYFPIKRPYL